jgi:cephalosporin-C deacetylase-like acetyl esterase
MHAPSVINRTFFIENVEYTIAGGTIMLTRRELLMTGAGAVVARAARVNYRDYSRCLPDYLSALAREAYERRNSAIEKLTSAAAIEARQAWVRETLWKLAGGMPERTPLNQRSTGGFERDGYRVDKIVYESLPGFAITANLYVPTTGRGPFPGVLFQMGHSLNGKAADSYQKCCQGLARLGFIVLAFDPMGQGERTYYPQRNGFITRLDSADTEHTLPGRQLLLAGSTAAQIQLWDAVRSLDVLAAHPQVDPKRLASTGQSGGATLTMLLAAVDTRLAAAAVSSGNTENFACAGFDPPGSTDDAEQNLVGSAPLGFDRWDLLYPLAPKPLLILASAHDFFGTYSPTYLSSGHEELEKLRRVYQLLGAGDRLAWDETPTPHGLTYFLRTRIYRWFARFLQSRPDQETAEPPVQPEPDRNLWVGPTGNTIRDFESRTPALLARDMAGSKPPGIIGAPETERLLALDRLAGAALVQLGRVPSENAEIISVEVATARSVWAPGFVFAPRHAVPDAPVIVLLEPRGRIAHWREGELPLQLAAEGTPVCAIDVRGTGDLWPEVGRGNRFYTIPHSAMEDYAWASLILGKPLVGQRVTDILAFVRTLGSLQATRGRRIVLAAAGELTVPALFAAVLEPAIASLYLADPLISFRSVLDADQYKHPTANLLPNLLHTTDLPQLAATLGRRRVILAGTVNGAGDRIPAEAVRAIYTGAGNIEVREESAWDFNTFSSL